MSAAASGDAGRPLMDCSLLLVSNLHTKAENNKTETIEIYKENNIS